MTMATLWAAHLLLFLVAAQWFQPITLTWVFHIPSTMACERFSPLLLRASADNGQDEQWDVVVVGSGIGGLCASAMCARHGLKTLCVEAHDVAGGVAHSFQRRSVGNSGARQRPFVFDSGPSLLSGMSARGTNPLRQVLDAVGVVNEIEWVTYDGWTVRLLF
jgi:hypothetical protein